MHAKGAAAVSCLKIIQETAAPRARSLSFIFLLAAATL